MSMTPQVGSAYESLLELVDAAPASAQASTMLDEPDQRDGRCYLYEPALKIAAEVALATGRPLLLRGESGAGKSSFAPYVARNLGARYYEHVVTARTEAQDLLYAFDVVKKLAAAQGGKPLNDFDYVVPGVLWWAWNPGQAVARGADSDAAAPVQAAGDPFESVNLGRAPHRAVVLIDEIDKADPDLPNNLLVALGSNQFWIPEVGRKISLRGASAGTGDDVSALVIVTTNDDRALSDAFLRRCIVHKLPLPTAASLVEVARRHFDSQAVPWDQKTQDLCKALATLLMSHREAAERNDCRPPSTAEYLDAVRACLKLGIDLHHPLWRHVEQCVLVK